MLEAGIPGLVFTLIWLPTKQLQWALVASAAIAVIALVVRLLQKSSTQYVFNAIFGIGIGWLFVRWAQHSGGSASEQALNFFLPGILISLGYTVVVGLTCLVRWPLIGFMLGAATDDPLGWHDSPQILQLCTRLTLVLMAPGAIGVALQGPLWVLGHEGIIATDLAVAAIATLRLGLGWALRLGSFSAMIWLLARNATPLETAPSGQA
jgi:hypothetical protein